MSCSVPTLDGGSSFSMLWSIPQRCNDEMLLGQSAHGSVSSGLKLQGDSIGPSMQQASQAFGAYDIHSY
jgi:hypothetical protein|tara:strand:- start:2251 stop:2457 length:207 start_codon:yes stop_codon:yes gene_type:complete